MSSGAVNPAIAFLHVLRLRAEAFHDGVSSITHVGPFASYIVAFGVQVHLSSNMPGRARTQAKMQAPTRNSWSVMPSTNDWRVCSFRCDDHRPQAIAGVAYENAFGKDASVIRAGQKSDSCVG